MARPYLTKESIKSWNYSVRIWTSAILESLDLVNQEHQGESGRILDAGGGDGILGKLVNHQHYKYFVLDANLQNLKRGSGDHVKVAGNSEKMPFKDSTFDVIMSCSCLQYLNQSDFFSECHRTLKPGGILVVHENGPQNPVIVCARIAQRIVGLWDRKNWSYRNTIKEYFKPSDIPGFDRIDTKAHGLLTPILFAVQFLGGAYPKKAESILKKIDDAIFLHCPATRALAFLNVVHFRKNS